MKFKELILGVSLFSIILISGCASIKPTDVCQFNIPVSELAPDGDFDYIDFLEFSIDLSRENNFQPPWEYNKDTGLLVFGHEKVTTMPGLKMVVYMWVANPHGDIDHVCMNYQILQAEGGSAFSDAIAREAILNFKSELEQKYSERIEDIKRINNKFKTN